MRSSSIPIVSACVVALAFASAGALEAKQVAIRQVLAVKGKCEKLVIGGKAITGKCAGLLWNVTFADARTGFYFFTVDGAALGFSGLGKKQVQIRENAIGLPIDRTIFGFQKKPDPPVAAKGQCAFENPMIGVAHVVCKAEGPAGHFEGVFTTDGKPPVAGHTAAGSPKASETKPAETKASDTRPAGKPVGKPKPTGKPKPAGKTKKPNGDEE